MSTTASDVLVETLLDWGVDTIFGIRATASALLNQRKKPVIMAGRGALGAGKELQEVAELLGAPIVKPVLGKACVPDASPYSSGGVGLLGTRPSQDALENCATRC